MRLATIFGACMAAFVAGAFAPATAQTATLTCTFHDMFEAGIVGGAVEYENLGDPGELTATFDFDALTFEFAGTPGVFAETPERLLGLGEEDGDRGIVELDRRSGQVRVTALTVIDGVTRYGVAYGQCRTASGATSF